MPAVSFLPGVQAIAVNKATGHMAPDSSSRNVTMKMIAEHLGVSLSTVAKSLKGGSRISPETVERVRAAATELGYVRNLDGVRLRTGKTFVVMAFLSAAHDEEIGDSGSVGLLHGIHKRIASTDYALRTVPIEHDENSLTKLQEVIRGNMADGIILDHTTPQDERVKYLLEQRVAFVTFGRTELFTPHPYFDIDNQHAAWLETNALIRQGARRIGLLNAEERYTFANQRLLGYRQALAESGIAFDAELVRNLAINPRAAREAGRELVEHQGADALVCVNDNVLLGARAGVRELGAEALQKTRLAFRTGTNIVNYLGTPAAAAFYPRSEAGWQLADLLFGAIEGKGIDELQRVVQCTLRDFEGD